MKKQVILLILSLLYLNSGIVAQNPDEIALEKKIAAEVAAAKNAMSISKSLPQSAHANAHSFVTTSGLMKDTIENDQDLYEVLENIFEINIPQENFMNDKDLISLLIRLNGLDGGPNVRLAALTGGAGIIYTNIKDYYQNNILNNKQKIEEFIKMLIYIYWLSKITHDNVRNYERLRPLIKNLSLPNFQTFDAYKPLYEEMQKERRNIK